jgi:hypothetical protein
VSGFFFFFCTSLCAGSIKPVDGLPIESGSGSERLAKVSDQIGGCKNNGFINLGQKFFYLFKYIFLICK